MSLRRPLLIHRRFARSGSAEPSARRLGRLPRRVALDRDVRVAAGLRARLLGLALLDRADAGPGLLIPRCSSVHTFGVRFALDIYFLAEDGTILDARRAVPPRRFVACRGAAAVLEVPVQSQRTAMSASASSTK
jgi:uncharacterized membrane protein (UPF0127 family)